MFNKWIGSFVVIAIVFWMTTLSVLPASASISSSRMEGVLVVDVSKSMLTSDPNNLSNEAMKMFIDMSSLKGDKIGVIAYANTVMNKQDLLKLHTEQDKKDLKNFIDSLSKFPNTDLSAGIQEAVNDLDKSHEKDYLPLIVLLADGNNDLKGKTAEQAEAALNKAVADAKAKGYPVYVIGLNADGKLNKNVLQTIAGSTNGNFFETSTAEELPAILSEIFAYHLKLKVVPVNELIGIGDFQDVTITIPNKNVLEANISLVSSQSVEMKLVDPAGKEQLLPSDQILLSTSKSYSMIKLIHPAQGDWTLKVKGVPQDKIDINLVFNYDLQLILAPLNKSYKAGDTVKISSSFEDNGLQIQNEELYKTMKATLFVKDLDKGKTKEVQLISANQGFTGDFTIGESGSFEVMVKAEGNSFYRETQPLQLTIEKEAAATVAKVSPSEEPSLFPWPYVAIIVVLAILLVTPIYSITKKRRKVKSGSSGHDIGPVFTFFPRKRKVNQGFSGQVILEIKDDVTGELLEPQYKKLKACKEEFSLGQLFTIAPEFIGIDQITFVPLTDHALLLFNKSNCPIEINGTVIDADAYHRFRHTDKLHIELKELNKSLFVTLNSLDMSLKRA